MSEVEGSERYTMERKMSMDPLDPRLELHGLLRAMPEDAEDSERFLALVRSVAEVGVQEPIKITADHVVVDGRHRWRAAKRLKLGAMPVVVVPRESAASVIVTSLVQRRHYGKSALAYLIYPLMREAHLEAVERREVILKANLRKGQCFPDTAQRAVSENKGEGVEALVERIGIGRRLYEASVQVHKLFAEYPDFKALMEPQILDAERPVGLGAVIAGYAGRSSTAGKARRDNGEESLFHRGFRTMVVRAVRVSDLTAMRPVMREVMESALDSAADCEAVKAFATELREQAQARLRALAVE